MNTLVLNLGIKSIRSIVFDSKGRILGAAYQLIHTSVRHGVVEQNPEEWWSASLEVMKKSLKNSNAKEQLKYITVTASSSCLTAVDKQGNILFNSLMVSDSRAKKQAEFIDNLPVFKKIIQDQGMCSSPSLMLQKALWIKENSPTIFDKVYKFLSPNDFLVFKLTGKLLTDEDNASKFYYNCFKKNPPSDLFNEIGISVSKFPEVVPVGSVADKINNQIASDLGLSYCPDVVLSSYDAICSVYGSGVTKCGDVSDVSGTITSVRAICDKAVKDPLAKAFLNKHLERNLWIFGGSNNLGGGVIEWAKDLLYSEVKDCYKKMESEVLSTSPGANGIIFLPFLLGERFPIWNHKARGVFFGLNRGHSRRHMMRAIFEGVAFNFRHMIESLEGLGVACDEVYASGGLARIDSLLRIKADVLGKKINVVNNFETTAVGALMIVLVSQGKYKNFNDAKKELVRVKMVIKPVENNFSVYSDIYNNYKKIYEALIARFDEHHEIISKHLDILDDRAFEFRNL